MIFETLSYIGQKLNDNGVKKPDLLERSLKGDLPKGVRDKIEKMIRSF